MRVPDTLLKKGKDGEILKDAAGAPVVNPAKFRTAARKAIKAIGYEQAGFHWKKAKIDVLLHGQSADIAQGVDAKGNKDEGAGDQGIMFGYACRETPDLMPAPIYYAHRIVELLAAARRNGQAGILGPDAKSQVTVRYEDGKPAEATQIVVSTQHLDATLTSDDIRKIVEPYVREALGTLPIAKDCKWYVNPTGAFVIGGPDGDAGLTGRKIIVDTYGGAAPHGGGAFSGKDPTKVDRSAAYAARYLAKNIVAAGLADRATIQLSYAIGVAKPLIDLCRSPRHRQGRRGQARDGARRGPRPLAARHPHPPAAQQADLRQDLGLRPFRPQARPRRQLLVGEDRPRAGAQGCGQGGLTDRSTTIPLNKPQRREPRAFFGRRSGKRLHRGQDVLFRDVLPALQFALPEQGTLDLAALLPGATRYILEIGYGGGEHLARQALANPDDRLHRRRGVFRRHRKARAADRCRGDRQCPALHRRRAEAAGDARARASLDEVYLLYPDPWPKTRHHKRRFVSPTTLGELARVLKPGGIFRFATDIVDYADWTLAHIVREPKFRFEAGVPGSWHLPYPGWLPTRYEQKARTEGRAHEFLLHLHPDLRSFPCASSSMASAPSVARSRRRSFSRAARSSASRAEECSMRSAKNGLHFRTPLIDERVRFECVGSPAEIAFRDDDVILLTMKGQDTQERARGARCGGRRPAGDRLRAERCRERARGAAAISPTSTA